jgi:potassium/hydrogen antiporter
MAWPNEYLLITALVLAVGIAASRPAARLGLPALLIFLLVGMGFGEDGPGGIQFEDFSLAFAVGNLALALILLDGGVRTPLKTFRLGLQPAIGLASLGVVLTAALVGAFGVWALSVDWRLGLLLGAIVSSTDAAAVFAMLRGSGVRLNERIAATLEIESGVNDPMAIFMTLMLIEVVRASAFPGPAEVAGSFLMQFGFGAFGGLVAGRAFGSTARWWARNDGLTAILVCAVGIAVFATVNLVGGSGFLAVYLFGVVLADRVGRAIEPALPAMDGLAWLAQSGMFLLLGLLVTPSRMLQVLAPALGISLFLIVVARPVAVWLCLAPWRFDRRESTFIAWTGLRGAVPIVLALFPLMAGVPHAELLFNVAFVVVLVSLLVQGTSLGVAARLLGVALPDRPASVAVHLLVSVLELVEFIVGAGSVAQGLPAQALELPAGCRLVAVSRNGAMAESADERLAPGDVVGVVGPPAEVERTGVLFARGRPQSIAVRRRLSLVLGADAPFGSVAAAYGLTIAPQLSASSLGDALEKIARRPLVEGDRLPIGRAVFVVVETREGRATRIALEL